MGSFSNYSSKPTWVCTQLPTLSVLLWEGPRTPRMNHNSSEISSLMELEARPPKFSVPPTQGTRPRLGPSEKSNCAILPHSSDVSAILVLWVGRGVRGRPGRATDALRSCSSPSWAEMDKERPQLRHGPPPLVPPPPKLCPALTPHQLCDPLLPPMLSGHFCLT